jgi:hypothetical protein
MWASALGFALQIGMIPRCEQSIGTSQGRCELLHEGNRHDLSDRAERDEEQGAVSSRDEGVVCAVAC